ncbi:hypothetical protein WAF17_09660 [Bernardetia sp. ABR2-2B]|uniref:hypothetical protein n=1 Tax=Bernardetia sp. ABR2-2B TaxID=3127472 RepID=UPI0030D13CA8
MKSLKKKFGRFAVSEKEMQKLKGGFNHCNCNYYYNCPKGGANYIQEPTGCQAVCCGSN